MFNRIINRIREPERGRETPPTSPLRTGSTTESRDGEADLTEGFLCPTCMENFSTPEDLQTHYTEVHGDDGLHTCPVCKEKFPTTDQLQIHYSTEHSSVKNGGLDTLKEEVAQLQHTLKEERGYSEDLKKEVARLSTAFSVGDKNDTVAQEADLVRIQLRAMEESKLLLTSEVVLLRRQLAEAVETNMSLKQKKDAVELKASELAEEHAILKCKLDNEGSIRTMLENQILELQDSNKNLEMQLNQRPAADDVLVLRQELVQVQTLMDQITREREQEKEGLLQECQALQSQYAKLLLQKDDVDTLLKELPKNEDIEMLRSQIIQLTRDASDLKASLVNERDENEELNLKMKDLEVLCSVKERRAEEANEDAKLLREEVHEGEKLKIAFAALQSSNQNTEHKCQKLEVGIRDIEGKLEAKMADLVSLEAELSEMKKLHEEKLSSKEQELVQVTSVCKQNAGELKDTAKQLAVIQTHYQEQVAAVDELKLQLFELKSGREEDERIKTSREEKMNELEAVITEHKDTIARLENERTSLYTEIEAGEGVNTALQQLQAENAALVKKLEAQQKLTEHQAAESAKSMDLLRQQMQETKMQLQNMSAKCEKLQTRVTEMTDELSSSQTKVDHLAHELKSKAELLLVAETDSASCKKTLEKNLEKKNSDLEAMRKKHDQVCMESTAKAEAKTQLERQLNESNESVGHLKKQYELLSSATEEKDTTINRATQEVNELKHSLELTSSKYTKLEEDLDRAKVTAKTRITELQDQLGQVGKDKVKLQEENTGLIEKNSALTSEHEANVSSLNKVIDSLKTEKERLQKDFAAVNGVLEERTKNLEVGGKELQSAKLTLQEKSSEVERLASEFATLKLDKDNADQTVLAWQMKAKDIEAQLASQQESNQVLGGTLQSVQMELTSAKSEIENLGIELRNSNEDCDTFKSDLTQLRKNHEETVSRLRDVEKELRETQATVADRDASLKQVSRQLKEIQVSENLLNNSLKSSKESVSNLEQRVQELEARLLSTVADLESVVLQKTSVETELFNTQRSLSDADEKYAALQSALKEREGKLARERQIHNQEIAELHKAREVLISQKLELENKISEAEDKLQKVNMESALSKTVSEKELAAFKATLEEVSKQLELITDAKSALEHDWEQQKSCYVLQLSTLNENMGTLRSDLAVQQDKNEQLEKKVDELNGDKLELSATLENALDERRALLERCLASEGECEKLRNVTSELRRKLDDALSGLHELGRENQTLQIEIAKLMNRKWADDGEVASCTSCQNVFSMTNRKHHCRHCGNIFCQDCSNKVATLASYKKPVRVCENCFNELGKN